MNARRWGLLTLILLGACAPIRAAEAPYPEAELRAAVEADWDGQETRKKRSPDSPDAIREALKRAERLLAALRELPDAPELEGEAAAFERLRRAAAGLDRLDEAARRKLYRELRWTGRRAALENPLLAGREILFMKRRRFICQMLHEYLGYYYDYGDIAGGGICVLEEPGRSLKTRDLTGGRLPKGNYSTLALSYDARTIYFAFAERAPEKPDYFSPDRRCFHIFAMDADGGNLRQLTRGPADDFDPCPLPDGGIAFMSSRRGGFTRCNNPWEPLPAHTLHRMDADGANVRALSFHETSEWHPRVLHDGRIVYIRWDYVDRSAANYHGLWVTNPDGTNTRALFGNYTRRINACYQPQPIPGSNRIAFLAGAHHADVGGSLVVVDPARVALDRQSGEDRFESIETLTPEVCFPEAPGWPKTYYHSPWPLAEDFYLLAYSAEPLPGMGSGVKEDTKTGLYYFDRFGNLELLYREEGLSAMYPIPLAPRTTPPVTYGARDAALGDEGEYFVSDVQRGHFPLPPSRPIVALRVFQVLPKSQTHIANQPRIGYANAESARMLLGSVPVEADGSAYFRAPAGKPLYFQAVDATGRAVQSMRSVTYLQAGERAGCVGCHEPRSAAPGKGAPPLATRRAASRIAPGPAGTRPLSFPLLVQPVLDRRCVRCHDGSAGENKSPLALTGAEAGVFSKSYESLRPYVRWYEWGGESITPVITRPGRGGADESRLLKIVDDKTHAPAVRLTDAERRRLQLWLDANAPFYGAFEKTDRLAQKAGQTIAPPTLQ